MDLEEFEFDLDVAAFESVASELTTVEEQQPEQQQHQPPAQQPDQQQQQQPPSPQQHQDHQQITISEQQLDQAHQSTTAHQQQPQQLHLQQLQPLPLPQHQPQPPQTLSQPPQQQQQQTQPLQQVQAQELVGFSANDPCCPLTTSWPVGKIVLVPIKLIQQQQQPQQHQHQQQQQSQQQQSQQQHHPQIPTTTTASIPERPLVSIKNEAANEVPKRKPCNCTKSQCLKLYCDCFANGEFCSGCNCTNCSNSLEKEKERQKAISQCLDRNPEAFRPKIGKAVKKSVGEPTPDSIERRHTKGCNCKRSGCLKNYCECYEAKILCSQMCKCCGCKNYEESFERKSLMQLTNSASENARGILRNLLPTNSSHNTGKDFTKCFITDKVIHASLVCLLQSAQQAEKDGLPPNSVPQIIQQEMGKCLRMIVDSATETSNSKKR